jgi:hypothetical protein
MGSPDLTPFVDLTLYDKSEQDIFNAALADLMTKMPDWTPREGNTEVLLMESLAGIVSELAFAVNRLPGSIMSILFQLYGVALDLGAQPTTTVTINLSDNLGHSLPSGIRLLLNLSGGLLPIVFTTDTAATVAPGSTSVTVNATGDRYTSEANGVAVGTALQVLDSILYVDSVTIASTVAGGADAETSSAWQARAVQRLARLTDTLVVPQHFMDAVLGYTFVYRALAIDNYNPTTNLLTAVDASFETGVGSWVAGANWTITQDTAHAEDGTHALKCVRNNTTAGGGYAYNTDYTVNDNELYSVMADIYPDATAGATYTLSVHWLDETSNPLTTQSVNLPITHGQWNTLEILGMTPPVGSAKAHIVISDDAQATPAAGQTIWVDKVALLTENGSTWIAGGTGGTAGSNGGHITIAVYGPSGPVSLTNKETILNDLIPQTATNLAIHIVDPTLTTINVTTTVKAAVGANPTTVQNAVVAALQSYLSPSTWGWGTTLYYNELIALISNVTGVDRVVSLTAPAADVAISGLAPLLQAGTIAVTVT